jgi:hypothetical protein
MLLPVAVTHIHLHDMRQVIDLPLNPPQPLIQLLFCLRKPSIPPLKLDQILPQLLTMNRKPAIIIRQPNPRVFLDTPVRLVI